MADRGAVDWLREVRHSRAVLARPVDDAVRTAVLTHTTDGRPIRLGLDAAGRSHLLVTGGGPDPRRTSGRALEIVVRPYVFDEQPGYHVDVTCEDPNLHDLFDELVANLVPRLLGAEDPYDVVVRSLDRWRELLRGSSDSLTHRREMGLFAELYVLDRMSAGAAFDPAWWRGPLREPKDLVTPRTWAEVKAVPPAADTVRINGLTQLEDIAGLDGYLCVLDVELDDDGVTCLELAEALEGRVTDREVFETLLVNAGLRAESADRRRWHVGDVTLCPAPAVPRIVPGMFAQPVPAGVRTVTYELDRDLLRSVSLTGAHRALAGLVRTS